MPQSPSLPTVYKTDGIICWLNKLRLKEAEEETHLESGSTPSSGLRERRVQKKDSPPPGTEWPFSVEKSILAATAPDSTLLKIIYYAPGLSKMIQRNIEHLKAFQPTEHCCGRFKGYVESVEKQSSHMWPRCA